MPTLCSCTIIGHAYEPAKSIGKGDRAGASIRFYTTDRVKNEAGEYEKQFSSHSAVIFGREAEWILRDCVKGSLLAVTGTFRVRKWTGSDGKPGAGTDIFAQSARILDRKEDDAAERPAPAPARPVAPAGAGADSDIPF